jgi:hypothetical protein
MWFEEWMGFVEESPEQVRAKIEVEGEYLVSRVNGRRLRAGRLRTPSLAELRSEQASLAGGGRSALCEVVGDVGALHRDVTNAGSLFQAASQFNLLEMTSPRITPEQGVGIYEFDRTQGPACAIACGAGTIFRNYFTPLGDQIGQTSARQIDCLEELGAALGQPGVYEMQNGYAMASTAGLERVNEKLSRCDAAERDRLRGLLRVGVQHEAEVLGTGHVVTQVYSSALPVAYGSPPAPLWEPFARLVLEATYEATLLVAALEGIEVVFLTRVGGGVFGNHPAWIDDAIVHALERVEGLDVRLVSYGRSDAAKARLVERWKSR